jgi:hypothetical protein
MSAKGEMFIQAARLFASCIDDYAFNEVVCLLNRRLWAQ